MAQIDGCKKKDWGKKVHSFGTMMHCRYGCISSANCTHGTIQALVRSRISLLLLQLFVRKLWVEGFIHESWSFAWSYPKEVAKLVLGNWCVSCLYDWKIDSNKSCCQIWMWMTFWFVVWVFWSHSLFGVFFFAKKDFANDGKTAWSITFFCYWESKLEVTISVEAFFFVL
jgi:hypothetical protein